MYLTGKNKRRKIRDAHEREKENNVNLDVKEEEVRDPAAMVSPTTSLPVAVFRDIGGTEIEFY